MTSARAEPPARGQTRPRVSVIIPTLDESSVIATNLARLFEQNPDEVWVVDATSADGTAELARAAGANVLVTDRGRGRQQNLGARHASGDILLFLHADCWLEPGALERLRHFVRANPRVPGGCFRMRVEASDPLFRAIDAAAHLRAGVLGIPYGDQAIFVTRRAFACIGGFPDVPLMDDVLLSLRLRRLGRLAVLPARVFVSPRRWRRRGIMRQTVRNWALTMLAAVGVRPKVLARYYPAIR